MKPGTNPIVRVTSEQPHDYLPLIVPALVPAGRVRGLDAWLVRARPAFRRWPF
jgi:hypothetical protein